MKIVPLEGLELVKFGDSKQNVKEVLGCPEVVENESGKDGIYPEKWEYIALGLRLSFDPEFELRLQSISVSSEQFSLNGFYPIGLSESELLKVYPSLTLEVKDGRFADYVDDSKELLFFLRDNRVRRVDIWPNIEKYVDRFGGHGN